MNINRMSKKDFEAVELIKTLKEPIICKSIVILPTNKTHVSGWCCMSFILIGDNGEIIGKIGGYNDALHLNGIGGDERISQIKDIFPHTTLTNWQIDCLKKSKLLRLFCRDSIVIEPHLCSDAEIYAIKDEKYE